MIYYNPYKRVGLPTRHSSRVYNSAQIWGEAWVFGLFATLAGFLSIFTSPLAIFAFVIAVVAGVMTATHFGFARKALKKKWLWVPGIVIDCSSGSDNPKTCSESRDICKKHAGNTNYEYSYAYEMELLRKGVDSLEEILSQTDTESLFYEQLKNAVQGARMVEWRHAKDFQRLRTHLKADRNFDDPSKVQKILNGIEGGLKEDVAQMNKLVEQAQILSLQSIQFEDAVGHIQIWLNEFEAICQGFKELRKQETPALPRSTGGEITVIPKEEVLVGGRMI